MQTIKQLLSKKNATPELRQELDVFMYKTTAISLIINVFLGEN